MHANRSQKKNLQTSALSSSNVRCSEHHIPADPAKTEDWILGIRQGLCIIRIEGAPWGILT